MTEPTTPTDGERRRLVAQTAMRLEREFAGVCGRETIARFIAEAEDEFKSQARVTTWLPVIVERFARERLRAHARTQGVVPRDKPSVLFLCVHNAGRSQMAAGWMRHISGDAVDIFSGGSDPGADVNATAVTAMAEAGVDISKEFPKAWTDEAVHAADVIVTMGCGDACPVYPGKRYVDWELTDPSGQPIEVVRVVRDDIERRVRALIAELGVRV
jgi:protein-tyrosine-phosphatase